MKRLSKFAASAAPLIIIVALLYAGLYIKPSPPSVSHEAKIFERGDRFYGSVAFDEKIFWLVGSDGKLLKSVDGASTWTKQSIPVPAGLQDISAWDAAHLVAVGNGPTVLRTTDGGATWSAVDVPRHEMATKLIRVKALPDGNAWAVGDGGQVIRSADFGVSWQAAIEAGDVAWNDIHFRGGRGWLVGEFGRIKRSVDNGHTWQMVESPTQSSLMAVAFRTDDDGVAVGLNGRILVTHNGGKAWSVVPSSTTEHLFDVIWDGQRWVTVGDKGIVLLGNTGESNWTMARVEQNDRSWYVNVKKAGGRYLLAGARFVTVDERNWSATDNK